jgi:hypothetical protein
MLFCFGKREKGGKGLVARNAAWTAGVRFFLLGRWLLTSA